MFGKAWREEFVVLYEDSSLIWFRDRDRLDPEGGVFLRDAPEMLAAGQVTLQRYIYILANLRSSPCLRKEIEIFIIDILKTWF